MKILTPILLLTASLTSLAQTGPCILVPPVSNNLSVNADTILLNQLITWAGTNSNGHPQLLSINSTIDSSQKVIESDILYDSRGSWLTISSSSSYNFNYQCTPGNYTLIIRCLELCGHIGGTVDTLLSAADTLYATVVSIEEDVSQSVIHYQHGDQLIMKNVLPGSEIQMTNYLGQIVHQGKSSSGSTYSISISGMKRGIYPVVIYHGNTGYLTRKIHIRTIK